MLYNCDDIKRILKSADDHSVDAGKFEKHMETCPVCRQSCDLGTEMEDTLRLARPQTAPVNFADRLTSRLKEYESEILGAKQTEAIFPTAVAVLSLALSSAILENWKSLKALFSGFNLNSVTARTGEFVSRIDIPKIDFSGIDAYITGTPLVLFAMVALTAIIWVFSILEFEKTIQ